MKTMELSNAQVLGIAEGLAALQNKNLELPAVVAYKIVKNLKLLAPTHQSLTEIKNDLIKKYAEDGSEKIEAGTESFEKFIEEYNPVLMEKTSVEIETITLHSLGEAKIEIGDMAVLEFMIEAIE